MKGALNYSCMGREASTHFMPTTFHIDIRINKRSQSWEKDHRSAGEQHKVIPATPDSKLAS